MSKKEILNKLGKKCNSCGSNIKLHIHHKLPYWLWSYVGKTDEGKISIDFIDNYEILCNDCHRMKHVFLNSNLVLGLKYHYCTKVRWRKPGLLNTYTYTVYFSKDYWAIETPYGQWVWNLEFK